MPTRPPHSSEGAPRRSEDGRSSSRNALLPNRIQGGHRSGPQDGHCSGPQDGERSGREERRAAGALSRRHFLALGGAAALVVGSGCGAARPVRAPFAPLPLLPHSPGEEHTLPDLPWAYDALEGAIDAETMEIHHSRHHQAYVNNLNQALAQHPQWFDVSLEELMVRLPELPEDIRTAVRNNGGGHYNHVLFWDILSPDGGGRPEGALGEAIARDLGGWEGFREAFTRTAAGVFGSGWAWLSSDPAGRLRVHGTPNQDTPLAEGLDPLMGVDVWEHAYYLRYQNERGRYVDAFLEVVDWDAAAARYARITAR